MPDFLVRIRPRRLEMLTSGPTEAEVRATQAHFAYLQDAQRAGNMLLAGRTLTADEDTFGIVIIRAESLAAAQRFVEEDPVVVEGVMTAEVFPFRVALLAKSWDDDGPPKPALVQRH